MPFLSFFVPNVFKILLKFNSLQDLLILNICSYNCNEQLTQKSPALTCIRCFWHQRNEKIFFTDMNAQRALHDKSKSCVNNQIVICKLCFSIYRFLAFEINWSFLSWNDLLLSVADFGKEVAAVLNNVWFNVSVVFEELDDKLILLCDDVGTSGTKFTRPSKIFVIVLSTFLVIPETK